MAICSASSSAFDIFGNEGRGDFDLPDADQIGRANDEIIEKSTDIETQDEIYQNKDHKKNTGRVKEVSQNSDRKREENRNEE